MRAYRPSKEIPLSVQFFNDGDIPFRTTNTTRLPNYTYLSDEKLFTHYEVKPMTFVTEFNGKWQHEPFAANIQAFVDGSWTLESREDLTRFNTGNAARHSCQPTCRLLLSGSRVFVVTKGDVSSGGEITLDYGLEFPYHESVECHCGESNCRGMTQYPIEMFSLLPPKSWEDVIRRLSNAKKREIGEISTHAFRVSVTGGAWDTEFMEWISERCDDLHNLRHITASSHGSELAEIIQCLDGEPYLRVESTTLPTRWTSYLAIAGYTGSDRYWKYIVSSDVPGFTVSVKHGEITKFKERASGAVEQLSEVEGELLRLPENLYPTKLFTHGNIEFEDDQLSLLWELHTTNFDQFANLTLHNLRVYDGPPVNGVFLTGDIVDDMRFHGDGHVTTGIAGKGPRKMSFVDTPQSLITDILTIAPPKLELSITSISDNVSVVFDQDINVILLKSTRKEQINNVVVSVRSCRILQIFFPTSAMRVDGVEHVEWHAQADIPVSIWAMLYNSTETFVVKLPSTAEIAFDGTEFDIRWARNSDDIKGWFDAFQSTPVDSVHHLQSPDNYELLVSHPEILTRALVVIPESLLTRIDINKVKNCKMLTIKYRDDVAIIDIKNKKSVSGGAYTDHLLSKYPQILSPSE